MGKELWGKNAEKIGNKQWEKIMAKQIMAKKKWKNHGEKSWKK